MDNTPISEPELFDLLDQLGISSETAEHEAVFTVAESRHVKDRIPGGHTKNLFVKDKKGNYFLIVAEAESDVPINTLHKRIGAKSRLSFANADRLQEYLGVEPGSVTAFAPVNDRNGAVRVVLDARLLQHDLINCHPLTNTKTTTISREDLIRYLEHVGHPPLIIDLADDVGDQS